MADIIKNTKDPMEKYVTYKVMMSKYNLAMKHGFYLEALLIDYAVLEDRLAAFLWHSGVTESADKLRFGNTYNKDDLKKIYSAFSGKDTVPILQNISVKTETLKAFISFAEKPYSEQSKYSALLYEALNSLDLKSLSEVLENIETWRGYRNEVIHKAMKKNIFSLSADLEENARKGMEYARVIDNAVRTLKKYPALRRSVHMSNKKDG